MRRVQARHGRDEFGYRLVEERVLVPVGGRAAAQEPQPSRGVRPELVPGAGWDQDRVAGT